jgi:hypothetical protein
VFAQIAGINGDAEALVMSAISVTFLS